MRKIQGAAEEERLVTFLRAVYGQKDFAEIIGELEHLPLPLPFHVRFFVLFASEGFESFEQRVETCPRVNRLRNGAAGKSLEFDVNGQIRMAIFAYGQSSIHENVIVVSSVGRTDELRAVKRFLASLYPEAVSFYSSRGEFVELIEQIRSELAVRFHSRVQFASLREQDSDAFESRRRQRSVVEWMDEEWTTLLVRSQERNQDLQSVKLALYRELLEEVNVLPSAILKVSRNSELEVSGDGYRVIKATLGQLERHVVSRFMHLDNRSLALTQYSARPLRLRFGPGVLESPADSVRLIEVLTKVPRVNYAIVHGNPYVNIELSDPVDGSSYSILSLEDNRLEIVPGIRSSAQSLDQIVRYIQERFSDGEIDYEVTI